jgi:predicted nucleic acid-binding protein
VREAPAGVYLDASALVKLIVQEPESDALRRYLADGPALYSSRIAAIEVRRVTARQEEVDLGPQVEAVLAGVDYIELDDRMTEAAAAARPVTLRTLDAIHLASATIVADGIRSAVIYDVRLADAARRAGLTVVAPGAQHPPGPLRDAGIGPSDVPDPSREAGDVRPEARS